MAGAKTVGKYLSKKLTLGGVALTAINLSGTIGDYKDNRAKGNGALPSAIGAVGKFAVEEALGWWVLPLGLAQVAPSLAMGAYLKGGSMARDMDRAGKGLAFSNSQFNDSRAAYTMRQAGMQLAQNSKYNLQQALMGNEASSMHKI